MCRNLLIPPVELGGCSPAHSAYIPGLATSGGFWWHTAAQPFNRRLIVCAGQAGFSLVQVGAPSRIRTCAHGSGECTTLTLSPLPIPLISKYWSAVGARAPWGVSGPGRGCKVQFRAARRCRAFGQAGLSCGSMPCWRSRARSRSAMSVSSWTCSARSGRVRCPAAHCSCRAALLASNSFSRSRSNAACA